MKKLRIAQFLMVITILLVIAFQFYWIRNLYKDEVNNFNKSADLLFRETLYKLQSQKFIIDTTVYKGPKGAGDNIFMNQILTDIQKMKADNASDKQVIITVNSTKNSISTDTDFLTHKNKFSNHIYINRSDTTVKNGFQRFTVNPRLKDSIPVKSMDSLYAIQLKKENYDVPFKIYKVKQATKMIISGFHTQTVPLGIFDPVYYYAGFQPNSFFLLKRIALPIIFSICLISITLLSFIILYMSLLSQRRLTDIKNEFIANITHELKTPISTVSVAIEAMRNFKVLDDPAKTTEYLDIAGLELDRLSLLVDKVLRLSMFESQQVEIKIQSFNIHDLIAEVIKSMQLQFRKYNATVELSAKGIDFMVNADRMHITSVLYNLLDNALKYSNGDPQINVSITDKNANVEIVVADKGVGIPEVYKHKIFDKFFRIPNGNQHNVKGYGLGLSYVSHIIKEHNGSIQIENNQQQGTIILIKLPKNNAS